MTADAIEKNVQQEFNVPWWIYALIVTPVVLIIGFVTFQPVTVLPRIAPGPGFALTDVDGELLTNESLRGQIVLYNFTYASCGENCPQTSRVMQSIQSRLAAVPELDAVPIKLVTISIDETDTPEALQVLAQTWDADPGRWLFGASPDPLPLKYIVGAGFYVFFDRLQDNSLTVDPAFVMVDGWGIIRAEYRNANPDQDIIMRDFGLLVEEVQNSSGAAKFAYEAAHLFLCYPR